MKRMIAFVLAALLLCGCAGGGEFEGLVKFRDMEYERPDMEALRKTSAVSCAVAEEGKKLSTVVDAIWDLYDAYDAFYTAYDLAYIHMHADMTDEYWQEEHDFCAANAAEADMLLDDLFYALAKSPQRQALESEDFYGPGYFDYYEGESIYDETFLDMMEQEQALISRYYDIDTGVMDLEPWSDEWYDACALPMADVLAQLALLRQNIAAYAGYDSYVDYAWDCYYYRDYTPDQAEAYLSAIRQELVPAYRSMNHSAAWDYDGTPSSEAETFDYVRTAAENMGGIVWEAFRYMEEGGLYDISVGKEKSGISFELFLAAYGQPYLFTSSEGVVYDKLAFAHEFGHFAMDYAAFGSYAGTDVLEVFSQGMEYLSLAQAEPELVDLKLADSLATYVEQAAYAAFEHRMYALPQEELTGENLLALYEEIGRDYGFDSLDWDPRDLVAIPHIYTNPLYIISYVVSNDAAMQLYQLELESPGAGSEKYMEHLTTEESYFLAFLREASLEDPMTVKRITKVRQLMEQHFPPEK